MAGTTESDSGLASGLVNTSVQVGGAIGLAILATFGTERTEGLLADGEPAAEALNSGYHLAYLIGAGLVLVAIAVAFTTLRARIPGPLPSRYPNLSLNRPQRVWASLRLQSWPRLPSGRRSRPARCPPLWPTRARRPAWGSRSAVAGARARHRRAGR